MDIRISPRKLSGTVTPPPSKSMAHRVILAEMLSGNPAGSDDSNWSEDIRATQRCVAALREANGALPAMDCGESGSTLRFLIPIALAVCGGGIFTGHGRLMERPQQPYTH